MTCKRPLNLPRARDNLTLARRYLRIHLTEDDIPYLEPVLGRLCADLETALQLLKEHN